MIEHCYQATCDSCGDTAIATIPGLTLKEFREELSSYGWKLRKRKDYCAECLKKTKATKGTTK
jgi:hypothetical protein